MGEKPIFTLKGHVFHIDPKTRKTWVPASTSPVDVSFFYDSGRNLYRILSTDKNQCIINSTITANMNFTKTSQKFGQWTDTRANTVYGVGFAAESMMESFMNKFDEIKASITSSNTSTVTPATNAKTTNVNSLEKPKIATNASPISNRNSIGSNVIENNVKDLPQENGGSVTAVKNATNSVNDSPIHKNNVNDKNLNHSFDNDLEKKYENLKYENERLRQALAISSINARKWEQELTTVKNHNSRLTSALQESTSNVEEWKKQLQIYKDENARLKKAQSEGTTHNENYLQMQKEQSTHKIDEYKEVISKLEEENSRLQSNIKSLINEKETMLETYRINQQQLLVLEEQASVKTENLCLLLQDFRSILSLDITSK